MRAWLTPDSLPSQTKCVSLHVPDSLDFEAVLRGALMLLQEAENWQEYGSLTPVECASAWQALNEYNFLMTECAAGATNMIGAIMLWSNSSTPDWALACEGQTLLVDDYPDLYAVVGNRWGGTMYYDFVLPDMRQRTAIGYDGTFAFGATGGEVNHTLTVDEMPEHEHGIRIATSTGSGSDGVWRYTTNGTTIDTESAGAADPHNNMQPYMALRYIIVVE